MAEIFGIPTGNRPENTPGKRIKRTYLMGILFSSSCFGFRMVSRLHFGLERNLESQRVSWRTNFPSDMSSNP